MFSLFKSIILTALFIQYGQCELVQDVTPSDDFMAISPNTSTIYSAESNSTTSSKNYHAYYGIMVVRRRSSNDTEEIISKHKTCISFYPEISNMSTSEEESEFHPILDTIEWSPCYSSSPVNLSNHIAVINGSTNYSNCTLVDSATAVQNSGGYGTLFVRDVKPPPQNITNLHLWLTFMPNKTYAAIMNLSDPDYIDIAVYSPVEGGSMNFSLIIIWLLATCTVIVGSYWSGATRYQLYIDSKQFASLFDSNPTDDTLPGPGAAASYAVSNDVQQNNVDTSIVVDTYSTPDRGTIVPPKYHKEDISMNITPGVAILFVLLACIMLVSLYFLYPYLVYVIITLFCIASLGALYACLEPLVNRIPCGTCRTPYFNLYLFKGQLELRHILLTLFCLSFVITWVCVRHESYSWVLQDILGVAFCINMLRTLRLPSLKICTILLSCLFFYDIFFVFITPLFTSDGNSIMVEVAKGGGSGEQLPMVFLVPHFTYSEVTSVCNLPNNQNLLGFGDVLVPGLLVAYVYSFDLKRRGSKWPIYFTINAIAYGVGLILTFLGLYLMRGAQPALLYLVPCTLLSTVICAAIRGELTIMWKGDYAEESNECRALLQPDVSDYSNKDLNSTTDGNIEEIENPSPQNTKKIE